MCIFCGERDDAFTDEGLDLHYWKHCPMLKRCEHCKQVGFQITLIRASLLFILLVIAMCIVINVLLYFRMTVSRCLPFVFLKNIVVGGLSQSDNQLCSLYINHSSMSKLYTLSS